MTEEEKYQATRDLKEAELFLRDRVRKYNEENPYVMRLTLTYKEEIFMSKALMEFKKKKDTL